MKTFNPSLKNVYGEIDDIIFRFAQLNKLMVIMEVKGDDCRIIELPNGDRFDVDPPPENKPWKTVIKYHSKAQNKYFLYEVKNRMEFLEKLEEITKALV